MAKSKVLVQQYWEEFLRDPGEKSFSCLYHTLYDQLFSFGLSICPRQELVRDVLQDFFTHIWVRKQELNHVRVLQHYALTSIRNNLYLLLRQEKELLTFAEAKEGQTDSPETDLIGEEQRLLQLNLLRRQIEALPPRQKEILYLRYYEGLDYEDIGRIMNISYQVARNFAYRALRKLKSQSFNLDKIILVLLPTLLLF